MFNSLFPESTDAGLARQAAQPIPVPATPWFRGFWGAMGQAPVRAGLETARAAKTVAPLQVGNPLAMSPTEQEEMLESEGINRRNMDRGLRIAIDEMTPDPTTTGVASMMMHDITRFVGKAVGYNVLLGPAGAVAGMGLDEGYNEAARRIDEGVDPATAAKLGAVKGVAAGVAVALPVAGRTLTQTLGLAAGGGPAAFIAEQTAAKHVLQSANYEALAEEIDPFDPLGLGVAFFGTLAFGAGAHAMRGARAKAAAKQDAAYAEAKMLEADAPPGELTPVARAVDSFTREQVDAAHVTLLQAHREGSALHRVGDIESAGAHSRALDRAAEQLAAGERVSVADMAPVDAARVQEAVAPALARILRVLDETTGAHHGQTDGTLTAEVGGKQAGYLDYTVYDGRPSISMVEVAQEMRRQGIGAELVRALQRKFPDAEIDWGMMTPEGAALRDSLPKIVQDVASTRAKVAELEAAMAERSALEQKAEEFTRLPKPTEAQAQAHREWIAQVGDRWNALHDRIDALEAEVRDAPLVKTMIDTAVPAKDGGATVRAPAAPDTPAAKPQPAPPKPAGEPTGAGKPAPEADFLTQTTAQIVAENPDMLVMMEGMDAPMKVSEWMAEVKALADQELADAPLVQVAAECALRG